MARTATVPCVAGRLSAQRRSPGSPPWWGEPVRRPAPNRTDPLLPWSADAGAAAPPDGAASAWSGGPAGLRRFRRSPWPRRIAAPGARSGGTPRRTAVLLGVGLLVLALVVVLGVRATAGAAPVATPFLAYTPPPGWSTAPPDAAATTDAPTLVGVVHGPRYTCDGEEFLRGFAAAALLPVDPVASPADRAERVSRWFAATAYPAPDGTPPDITVAPPRAVRVTGPAAAVEGTVTETTVRAPGGRGDCPATAGRVLVLAVPHDGGAALLLVAGDTEGGPADPAPVDPSALDAVVASARLPAA